MKFFVTGAGGLLGAEFVRLLPGMGHTVAGAARRDLDVTDAAKVARAIEAVRPDAVLHCAAMARLEPCEADPDAAFSVNRDGAGNVAEAATATGARMVHFSTDYVFDGTGRTPYPPDHVRKPLSVYARSKAEGEDAVWGAAPDALVVRVSWLYGGRGENFARMVLRAAREGRTLRMARDSWSRPSWVENVVRNVVELVEREVPAGAWHVTDAGVATRLEQAREVLRIAGKEAEIQAMDRAELWPDVPRPAYSVLDVSATEAFLGRPMEPWKEALRRYLEG